MDISNFPNLEEHRAAGRALLDRARANLAYHAVDKNGSPDKQYWIEQARKCRAFLYALKDFAV